MPLRFTGGSRGYCPHSNRTIMDFDALSRLIRERRAVFPRFYTAGEISETVILELLENANWAPSHRHTEPWRFKIVRGMALERLGRYMAERYREMSPEESFSQTQFDKMLERPLQASAVIAICMQRDEEQRVPEWEEIAAVGCAVQNLWLSASARGLAGYWSSPKTMVSDQLFFDLKENERCLGLFYLSTWEAAELPSRRGPIEGKISWIDR